MRLINIYKNGFTLVEVTLVTSLVLGLVATLALSANAYQKAGEKARCVQTMAQLGKTLQGIMLAKGIEESSSLSVDTLRDALVGSSLDTGILTATGSNLNTNYVGLVVQQHGKYTCPEELTSGGGYSVFVWDEGKGNALDVFGVQNAFKVESTFSTMAIYCTNSASGSQHSVRPSSWGL